MNLQAPCHVQLHLEIPKIPMDFIDMDTIDPFGNTGTGNQYALIIIGMITNCSFCIPVKTADVVVDTYLKKVYC